MKLVAKNVCVDSGTIVIADLIDFLEFSDESLTQLSDRVECRGKQFNIPSDDYQVHWNIKNTYNGEIDGEGDLILNSGIVVVIDPCYLVRDGWGKLLRDTKFLKNPPAGWIIIDSMGGDGIYEVEINLLKHDGN